MKNRAKQNVIKHIINASKKYNLIQANDTIAVGVSGGKDSLVLLEALATLKNYCKFPFNLIAITINMQRDQEKYQPIKEFTQKLGVPYYIYDTDIFEIVFDLRQEKNPCSLCAKMRRGALCEKAKELGANKIALGHHADDFVETFLMSFIYEGRLSTFMPTTYMSKTDITSIRPMIFCSEKEVVSASKDLPIVKNNCPADKHTKRQYVKELINKIKEENKIAEVNMLSALTHPERYNLLDKLNIDEE